MKGVLELLLMGTMQMSRIGVVDSLCYLSPHLLLSECGVAGCAIRVPVIFFQQLEAAIAKTRTGIKAYIVLHKAAIRAVQAITILAVANMRRTRTFHAVHLVA